MKVRKPRPASQPLGCRLQRGSHCAPSGVPSLGSRAGRRPPVAAAVVAPWCCQISCSRLSYRVQSAVSGLRKRCGCDRHSKWCPTSPKCIRSRPDPSGKAGEPGERHRPSLPCCIPGRQLRLRTLVALRPHPPAFPGPLFQAGA